MQHHTEKAFTVTLICERQLGDFSLPNDDLCRVHPTMIMGSRNFHWWELHTGQEITRIEAIRAAGEEADEDDQWPYPRRFRIVSIISDEQTEREVASSALFDRRQGGISPATEPVLRRMNQADFVSLCYAVGRRTVTIVPQTGSAPMSQGEM